MTKDAIDVLASCLSGRKDRRPSDAAALAEMLATPGKDKVFLTDWGPRKDSKKGGESYRVLSLIKNRTMTAKEMAEEAGATERRVRTHIRYWTAKGAPIRETKDGFTLAPVTPPAAVQPGRDRFGSRLGTDPAKANAVLSDEPKTMKQLVEEGKLSNTVYDHMNRLMKRGLVEKVGDGYRLATPTPGVSGTRAPDVSPPTTQRDRFGSLVGSDMAKINAVLTYTPKTMSELIKESGVQPKLFQGKYPQMGPYYNHLKKLAEAGFVVKTEKGYALKTGPKDGEPVLTHG